MGREPRSRHTFVVNDEGHLVHDPQCCGEDLRNWGVKFTLTVGSDD